jgi:hypothetical protein
MQISIKALKARWLWSCLATLVLAMVLGGLDGRLKQLSGYGTMDLQSYDTAVAFSTAFHAWGMHAWLARAGFNLGFDYLFMAAYGVAFFYSGILVREAFAPRPGPLRRLLAALAMAPVAAALLDVVENGLEFWLMVVAPTDGLAAIAFAVTSAKRIGLYIGVLLLAGAVFARILERKRRVAAGP